MSTISGIEIKKISNDLAQQILGLSELPKRGLCSTLEGVYITNEDEKDTICNGVYKLNSEPMGEPSVYGKVYQACCQDNCDFVAKWQGYIKAGDKQKTKDDVLKEACLQIKASKKKLGPKVREIWECEKGIIIVMDALKITASRDLKMLSEEQLNAAVLRYVSNFKDIISNFNQKSEYLSKFLEKDENFINYDDIVKARREINKFYYPNKLPETIIEIEDTDEEIETKRKIIKDLINLLINLYNLGISHGDTHLNNYMRGMDGVYKLIDFGESEENSTMKELLRDLKRTRRDLIKLVEEDGYNNIEYLVDYFNELLDEKGIRL